jgi:hypothetical protein
MIIFDEKEYALKLLQDGYIRKNKKLKDIFILAKYFKYKGLSRLQACKEVINFINKFDDSVYSDIRYKLKAKALNTVNNVYNNNYTFRFDINIKLSKQELEIIANLKSIGEKQVLFVFLVMSKFFKNGTNTFYISFKDVFDYVKMHYDRKNSIKIINKLINNKYIEIVNKYKISKIVNTYSASLYKRRYFKVNIKPCDNIIYTITNFHNLMSDFAKCMKLIDGGIYCVQCGIPIKQTSNRRKYCSSCWKDKELERQRIKWHKYKNRYRPATALENPANLHE